MGRDLKTINGAVFYVDLLGFGALTKGQIPLTKLDFKAWLKGTGNPKNNQFFAAQILVKFRKILMDLNDEIPKVTVSQLSDCAFIWGEELVMS